MRPKKPTCPGILPDRIHVDPGSTLLLGKFVVANSNTTSLFSIEGEALTNFLLSDINGGATLVIVSETTGKGTSYVHGFVSKRHPTLSPPALRLSVSTDVVEKWDLPTSSRRVLLPS